MTKDRTTSVTRRLLVVAAGLLVACTSGTSSDDGSGGPAPADDHGSSEDDQGASAPRDLRFVGPDDGDLVGADELGSLSFDVIAVTDADDLADLAWRLNGDEVTTATPVDEVAGSGVAMITYDADHLGDGEHELSVAASDGGGDVEDGDDEVLHTFRFVVKSEPPELEIVEPTTAVAVGQAVTLTGRTEAGAEVEVGEERVTAGDDGSFTLELDEVGGPLPATATDAAGNRTTIDDAVRVVASRVEIDEIRTVHATFWAWATPELRDPIDAMIEDGQINSLQLDLKDEGGHLGYDSQVPLAQEVGAGIGPLDLEQVVADLHARDVAVIGRIVAFADPTLASWAWEHGERDWVIQEPDGGDYFRGSYAGFSNYTHEDVIAYNLDIAEEAARAGVDHILWDYIRRPEGMDNYVVPGLEGTPEEAIVEFARLADERLAPYGVTHGASVYGIAADRPTQIGQDIPALAEHLDYVAPMIYPSHWGAGEYGVADPNRQPYDIVRATLEVWEEAVAGARARVVPWLEDTPYRAWDRPHQVREQIRATRDHGIDEWLMWNPGARYTPEAYERRG